MKHERQEQIVDAFIDLVAARGLEHVPLDDVAEQAGVQRAALRHFVGNRDELIQAAITEMARRGTEDIEQQLTLTEMVALLMDPKRMKSLGAAERAWWELLPEAMRTPESRAVMKQGYVQLIANLTAALRREHPDASRTAIADTAYAIACMAEYNYILQRLEFPAARCKGLREAALTLAHQLC